MKLNTLHTPVVLTRKNDVSDIISSIEMPRKQGQCYM